MPRAAVYPRPQAVGQTHMQGPWVAAANLYIMHGTLIRRGIATVVLAGALVWGPLALSASAQQPSDPSGCGSTSCTGGVPDGTDVLGGSFNKTPGPGGSLAKTGGESSLSLVAGAGIGAAALGLRKVAQRT